MLTYEQSGVNIDEGNRAVSLDKREDKGDLRQKCYR